MAIFCAVVPPNAPPMPILIVLFFGLVLPAAIAFALTPKFKTRA
jgi:hypothetical protein